MTPEPKERWNVPDKIDALILSNAKRVVKLLELRAPAEIVASDVATLLKRLTVRYGPALWTALGNSMTTTLRNANDLCGNPQCWNELEPGTDNSVCAGCEFKEEIEIEERYGVQPDDDAPPR